MAALDSHRSVNPTVNYACEGSRLQAPYENHPETIPTSSLWKNCFPQNWCMVPKRLRTAELGGLFAIIEERDGGGSD